MVSTLLSTLRANLIYFALGGGLSNCISVVTSKVCAIHRPLPADLRSPAGTLITGAHSFLSRGTRSICRPKGFTLDSRN